MSVLTLIAVFLGWAWFKNPDTTFEFKRSKDYTQSVEFSDLDLIPGQSKTYELNLNSKTSGKSELRFAFEEMEASPLKNYVYCVIKIGDEVICDKRLDKLTDGRTFTYSAELKANQPFEVIVKYYMPANVSNEAQGAYADIKLNITATNELGISCED